MIPIRDQLPTRIIPFVNYGLIAANVLCFLWQLAAMGVGYVDIVKDWGFIPARFLVDPVGDVGTIFTSMFMHGGWMHLLGNMLFLWVFGDNIEDAIGHFRYVVFYLLAGLLAAASQMLIDPQSIVPMVGASGAISGVLAAYVSLYPRARVLVLFPIFILVTFLEFPAWLVILEWFVLQILSGVTSLAGPPGQGGVAFFAHIGGFVAGLFLIRGFILGRGRQGYEAWHGWTAGDRGARGYRSVRR